MTGSPQAQAEQDRNVRLKISRNAWDVEGEATGYLSVGGRPLRLAAPAAGEQLETSQVLSV